MYQGERRREGRYTKQRQDKRETKQGVKEAAQQKKKRPKLSRSEALEAFWMYRRDNTNTQFKDPCRWRNAAGKKKKKLKTRFDFSRWGP